MMGKLEEVAREACRCGAYRYAPKTWKAIHNVGIKDHLPERLGGCFRKGPVRSPAFAAASEALEPTPPAQESVQGAPEHHPTGRPASGAGEPAGLLNRNVEPKMEAQAAREPETKEEAPPAALKTEEVKPGRRKAEWMDIQTGVGVRRLRVRDGLVSVKQLGDAARVSGTSILRFVQLSGVPMEQRPRYSFGASRGGPALNVIARADVEKVVALIREAENGHGRGYGNLHTIRRGGKNRPHRRRRHVAVPAPVAETDTTVPRPTSNGKVSVAGLFAHVKGYKVNSTKQLRWLAKLGITPSTELLVLRPGSLPVSARAITVEEALRVCKEFGVAPPATLLGPSGAKPPPTPKSKASPDEGGKIAGWLKLQMERAGVVWCHYDEKTGISIRRRVTVEQEERA